MENQGGYFPETLELQLDKLVGIDIQQGEEIDRSLKLPLSDTLTTSPEVTRTASQYLRWNSTATDIDAVAVSTSASDASDVAPLDVSISAAAAGSAADVSREDHVHLLPTTVPRLATENTFTESNIWFKGSDVASTGTLTLGAGNWFDITGTTAITSITTIGVGTFILLQFDGALLLTYHSTDLLLPGGEDILTQAGDIAVFYEHATGDWRLISYNGDVSVSKMQTLDLSQKVTFFDDFIGTISSPIETTPGSGANTSVAVISAGAGGRITMNSSDADGTNAANTTIMTLDTLDWRADQGSLRMEVKLQIDDVSEAAVFIGFTDNVMASTTELPIFKASASDNIDSDATNAVGIGYDVDGTTDEWFHGGVKAGTDTSATHSGSAPTDNTYVILRVEVNSAGAVEGFVDGTSIGTATVNAVTTTTPLTPCICVSNRSANKVTMLVDYIWVQADR